MVRYVQALKKQNDWRSARPNYVYHQDFEKRNAATRFDAVHEWSLLNLPRPSYMPNDVTCDLAKRMHYAAHRMHRARTKESFQRWQSDYFSLRDQIVLGNTKLIFRIVRRRMGMNNYADDLIGDCQIVLIQAVSAFNPWLGIRFSTYAYTCLARAVARQSRRLAANWYLRTVPIESFAFDDNRYEAKTFSTSDSISLDDYFRKDHPLLTDREKQILSIRYSPSEDDSAQTLERVGQVVGLSKERVRQVQFSALQKLRDAFSVPEPLN